MTDPRQVDPLAVGLIKALNAGHTLIRLSASDRELIEAFGPAVQPLVDGIRAAIRDELERMGDRT